METYCFISQSLKKPITFLSLNRFLFGYRWHISSGSLVLIAWIYKIEVVTEIMNASCLEVIQITQLALLVAIQFHEWVTKTVYKGKEM